MEACAYAAAGDAHRADHALLLADRAFERCSAGSDPDWFSEVTRE
jgi:hypothetical protein